MGACCSAVDKNTRHTKDYKNQKTDIQEADINKSNENIKPKTNSRISGEAFLRDGDIKTIQGLINDGEFGVNDLIFDGGSKTALHIAIQNPHKSVVELILNKGADVNIPELNTGNSAIFMAAIDFKLEYVDLLFNTNKVNFELRNNNGKDIFEYLEDFRKVKFQRGLVEEKNMIDVILRKITDAKDRVVEILDDIKIE
jgi:ankyrin repeat protein